jgi:putative protein-disulfide isomerase
MSPIKLTYAFDAYCGWCYGFGPALREFADAEGDRVQIEVLSGGLFVGPRAQPIGAYTHIPAANERIAGLTGVTFGEPYQRMLAEGVTVMDSLAPAIGLIVLSRQAPDLAVSFTGAIQAAFYRQGRDLRDVAVYRSIAREHGLDVDAVTNSYEDPATRAAAQEQFRTVRSLGVAEYPTLLLHTAGGTHRLGGAVASGQSLSLALNAHLAGLAA